MSEIHPAWAKVQQALQAAARMQPFHAMVVARTVAIQVSLLGVMPDRVAACSFAIERAAAKDEGTGKLRHMWEQVGVWEQILEDYYTTVEMEEP